MHPSQEPAQPQQSSPPPADPTAEPPGRLGESEPGSSGGLAPHENPVRDPSGRLGESEPGSSGRLDAEGPGGHFGGSGGYGGAAGPGEPADFGYRGDAAGAYRGDTTGAYRGDTTGAGHSGDTTGAGHSGDAAGGSYGGDAAGGGYGLAHPSGPDAHAGGPDQYGMDPAGYADGGLGLGAPNRNRRPWRRTLIVAVVTGVSALVLGGPLGLLWAWLAPSVPVIDAGQNGIVVNDPSPEEYIAADGWFTLLGLGFGLLVAIVAWLVLRRDRGPFLLLGVVTGTLGAGYLVAPWVGEMIGRSDYRQWQATAAQGATYLAPPEVHSVGAMLVPAFAAAIVLTLLAGWSNDPELDDPGARPGYGPNAGSGPNASYGTNAGDGPDAGYGVPEPDQQKA